MLSIFDTSECQSKKSLHQPEGSPSSRIELSTTNLILVSFPNLFLYTHFNPLQRHHALGILDDFFYTLSFFRQIPISTCIKYAYGTNRLYCLTILLRFKLTYINHEHNFLRREFVHHLLRVYRLGHTNQCRMQLNQCVRVALPHYLTWLETAEITALFHHSRR